MQHAEGLAPGARAGLQPQQAAGIAVEHRVGRGGGDPLEFARQHRVAHFRHAREGQPAGAAAQLCLLERQEFEARDLAQKIVDLQLGAEHVAQVARRRIDDPQRHPLQRVALRVVYAPPCHLSHVLGAKLEVHDLLRQIPGLELLALEEAELCCGAGGLAFARVPEMSDAVLARKLERIAAAAPDAVLNGNPGCLLRLEAGARARGQAFRVLHPMRLLALAMPPAPRS